MDSGQEGIGDRPKCHDLFLPLSDNDLERPARLGPLTPVTSIADRGAGRLALQATANSSPRLQLPTKHTLSNRVSPSRVGGKRPKLSSPPPNAPPPPPVKMAAPTTTDIELLTEHFGYAPVVRPPLPPSLPKPNPPPPLEPPRRHNQQHQHHRRARHQLHRARPPQRAPLLPRLPPPNHHHQTQTLRRPALRPRHRPPPRNHLRHAPARNPALRLHRQKLRPL